LRGLGSSNVEVAFPLRQREGDDPGRGMKVVRTEKSIVQAAGASQTGGLQRSGMDSAHNESGREKKLHKAKQKQREKKGGAAPAPEILRLIRLKVLGRGTKRGTSRLVGTSRDMRKENRTAFGKNARPNGTTGTIFKKGRRKKVG